MDRDRLCSKKTASESCEMGYNLGGNTWERLQRVQELSGGTLSEGRALIETLRPPGLDENGLVAGLVA